MAAAAAGAKGYLPPRTAVLTTLISTVNTGLAIAAKGRRHKGLTGVAAAAAALGTGWPSSPWSDGAEGGGAPATGGYRSRCPGGCTTARPR